MDRKRKPARRPRAAAGERVTFEDLGEVLEVVETRLRVDREVLAGLGGKTEIPAGEWVDRRRVGCVTGTRIFRIGICENDRPRPPRRAGKIPLARVLADMKLLERCVHRVRQALDGLDPVLPPDPPR